jgi:antitoxin MazE
VAGTNLKGKRRKAGSKPNAARAAAPAGWSRKVARWGNSLGFRIPQEAADRLNLREGGEVRIEVNQDSMTITPARRRWTEAELLRGVTPDKVAGEVDWGGPVGREVW